MNTSISSWVAGARPRTLPAALTPILAGSAAAVAVERPNWPIALLCLLIAVALQVGVNYANDYSDGVRGTDDERVGPVRLVASGLASPGKVKAAAFLSFGVAAVAGLAAVALTGHWWLVLVGVVCILAAWFYTGGNMPYGYLGLGELMVFIFFGLVATVGTTYLMSGTAPLAAWAGGTSVGALASAILVANNIRDIPSDLASGKLTLPARMGDRNARIFYAVLCGVAVLGIVAFAALTTWAALIAALSLGLLIEPLRRVLGGAQGRDLIPVIASTGFAGIGLGLGLLVGVYLG